MRRQGMRVETVVGPDQTPGKRPAFRGARRQRENLKMAQGLPDKLSGVPETLLLPLWARAKETKLHRPIVRDARAVELVEQIDYDFGKFNTAWKSQLGIAIRTKILDMAVTAFIEKEPRTTVINLGAGLDSRFQRVDNGSMQWYDLDLPEVIAVKLRFFNESERYRLIARSVMDFSWMDDVNGQDSPMLIIAEGLLMYFNEKELRTLFDELVKRFPSAEMLFEMIPIGALGTRRFHDALADFNVEFKWSLINSRLLETWNNKIRFIEEWCILDFHWERWGWLAPYAHFPFTRLLLGDKIVRVNWLEKASKNGLPEAHATKIAFSGTCCNWDGSRRAWPA